jgi:internalin A
MLEASQKPRRRWTSLSLRGLMLLVLVLGVLMGWQARKVSLQRRAVAAIERVGGQFIYDFVSPTGEMRYSNPPKEPAAPKWLRQMLGDEYFQAITGVYLGGGSPFEMPDTSAEHMAAVETLMASLTKLDQLQTLAISSNRLTPAALADLGRLTGLTTLMLDDAIETDAQLASLRGLTRLENLTISLEAGTTPKAPRIEKGLANLAPLIRLRKLHLTGDSVLVRSLDFIDGMAHLESLMVDHSPLDDTFLAKLAKKANLREVILRDTDLTDAGMTEIGMLANLEFLSGRGSMLTDSGLSHLAGLKNLSGLALAAWSPNITDAGFAHLAGLTQLKLLQIQGGRVTDAGLSHLSGMTAMKNLWLAGMPISDAGLVHLSKMAVLFDLDLTETKVTGAGLVHLPKPMTLRCLGLARSPVTDDGLAGLSAMTSLSILELERTSITDAGLAHLTGMKSLALFNIHDTAVTKEGLAALRPGWNPPAEDSMGSGVDRSRPLP